MSYRPRPGTIVRYGGDLWVVTGYERRETLLMALERLVPTRMPVLLEVSKFQERDARILAVCADTVPVSEYRQHGDTEDGGRVTDEWVRVELLSSKEEAS